MIRSLPLIALVVALPLLAGAAPPAVRLDNDGHWLAPGAGGSPEARPARLARRVGRGRGTRPALARRSSAGLPAPLRAALGRVEAACPGYRFLSGYRPGARVAGSRSRRNPAGRRSLHASGLAADFAVDSWSCAYAVLADWPGGMSNDPTRVVPHHIHLSYAPGGHEWGVRFAHYHGGRRHVRLAHHRRHYRLRYASPA